MKVNIGSSYSKEITFNYSVPQGSCSGANQFCWYSATIENHINNIGLSAYADDHSLDKDFDPNKSEQEELAILCIQENVKQIETWMNHNRLKLNTDKTEMIYFGSKQNLRKCKKQ